MEKQKNLMELDRRKLKVMMRAKGYDPDSVKGRKEFATICKIGEPMLRHILTGVRNPGGALMALISIRLSCSELDLMRVKEAAA